MKINFNSKSKKKKSIIKNFIQIFQIKFFNYSFFKIQNLNVKILIKYTLLNLRHKIWSENLNFLWSLKMSKSSFFLNFIISRKIMIKNQNFKWHNENWNNQIYSYSQRNSNSKTFAIVLKTNKLLKIYIFFANFHIQRPSLEGLPVIPSNLGKNSIVRLCNMEMFHRAPNLSWFKMVIGLWIGVHRRKENQG